MTRRVKNLLSWAVTLLQSFAALAVLGWLIEPSPPVPTSGPLVVKPAVAGSGDLGAPAEDQDDLLASIDRFRSRRWAPELFPKPSEPRQAAPPPAPPPLQVKLLAIIKDGGKANAVFSTPNGELVTLGADDWFDPDSKDTRVTRIDLDRVELEHHSRSLELTLAPEFAKD